MAALGRSRQEYDTMQPLHSSPSFDGNINSIDYVMNLVDDIANDLCNINFGHLLIMNLSSLVNCLTHHGPQVESICKEQLDRAYVAFRRYAYDERLIVFARKQIMHLIELRARNWLPDEAMNRYYRTDESLQIFASDSPSAPLASPLPLVASPPPPPLLAPGETIKTSGKFPTPTKIPGKNYFKDEVVIRNSDSGKVMGIKGRRVHMIEELSETVISFQRVNPGARERLVQVTGPDEAHITYARQLISQTITRNASPVPFRTDQGDLERIGGSSSSVNSSASDESTRPQGYPRSKLHHSLSTNDASIGDYKYTVNVGANSVKITGSDHSLVMKSKLALDKFFESEPQQFDSGEFFTGYDDDIPSPPTLVPEHFESSPKVEHGNTGPQMPTANLLAAADPARVASIPAAPPKYRYSRQMLCMLSQSQLANEIPADWETICPAVLRKVYKTENSFTKVVQKVIDDVSKAREQVEKVHAKAEEEAALRWTPPPRSVTPVASRENILRNRFSFGEELQAMPMVGPVQLPTSALRKLQLNDVCSVPAQTFPDIPSHAGRQEMIIDKRPYYEMFHASLMRHRSVETPSPEVVSVGDGAAFYAHLQANKTGVAYSPLTPSPDEVDPAIQRFQSPLGSSRASSAVSEPGAPSPTTLPFRPKFAYSNSCATLNPYEPMVKLARANTVPANLVSPKNDPVEWSPGLTHSTAVGLGYQSPPAVLHPQYSVPTAAGPSPLRAHEASAVEVPSTTEAEVTPKYQTNISFRPKITNPRLSFMTPEKK